jgi:hypothetical protein
LSRRTIRGPATGFFHTAVCTVLPCQVTSCGIPTLTDSRAPGRCPEVTTSSPSHHFIVSDDVERSCRFYTEVLGGKTIRLFHATETARDRDPLLRA